MRVLPFTPDWQPPPERHPEEHLSASNATAKAADRANASLSTCADQQPPNATPSVSAQPASDRDSVIASTNEDARTSSTSLGDSEALEEISRPDRYAFGTDAKLLIQSGVDSMRVSTA